MVPDSTHFLHQTHPDIVVDAVRLVLRAARARPT
jgi:hypothetical protein